MDLQDQCQAASYAPVTHTCASIATKWRYPPINSSAASMVSANVHQQTEAQRGQDRTAVHQLRSLLCIAQSLSTTLRHAISLHVAGWRGVVRHISTTTWQCMVPLHDVA